MPTARGVTEVTRVFRRVRTRPHTWVYLRFRTFRGDAETVARAVGDRSDGDLHGRCAERRGVRDTIPLAIVGPPPVA